MIGVWILFVVFTSGSTMHEDFNSKEACEAAGQKIEAMATDQAVKMEWACLNRGQHH